MKIHAIQTGHVKIKQAQVSRRPGGMMSVLFGSDWSDWLPIYAWAVEHPEGILLVDTGETARTMDSGYFTPWHPYYKMAVKMRVRPEDEIGPQLRRLGFSPSDVSTVVLTHLHTDHAGGISHFPHAEFLVSAEQLGEASGLSGKMKGYLPQHWPEWFRPTAVSLVDGPFGPFERSRRLSENIIIVPTPGHTPGHLSVIVRDGEISYFLAGDVSYTQGHLIERSPDGVGPDPGTSIDTIDRVLEYAESQPTVYLPSHDPESAGRLERREILDAVAVS